MRPSGKISLMTLFVSVLSACAPVKFGVVPDPGCGADGIACIKVCEGSDCVQEYKIERTVGQGLVDILIVNDNSGSMSTEQRKMADKFPSFIDSLSGLDFHLAMTTTDISSRYTSTPSGSVNPVKNGGLLQDGNLIEFASGLKYLSNDSSDKYNLFNQTIVRSETIACEEGSFTSCPSGDERGIFAVNLALDRMSDQFMRPLAHLAVIILSDEDERGLSDKRSISLSGDSTMISRYPLESYDKPETLVSRFKESFPDKTLSVHSIIVRPGDKQCLAQQTELDKKVRGVEGYSYAKLTELTGGHLGSICDNDFGSQLSDIASTIQNNVASIPFSCRPVDDQFEVELEPKLDHPVNVTADFDQLTLNFDEKLPPLTKITLSYKCQVEH